MAKIAATGTSASSHIGRSKWQGTAAASCMTAHSPPFPSASQPQAKPQRQAQDDRCTKRPLEQRQLRAPRQRVELCRRKAVDVGIDDLQLRAVLCAEEAAVRRRRDGLQPPEIDTVLAR